jgi:two-component system, OmpR family, response regulator RegX3
VKNLRAKIHDDPREPRFIWTVHGVGYRFEAPQAEEG